MVKHLLLSIVVLVGAACPSSTNTIAMRANEVRLSYLGPSGERRFWPGAWVEGIAVGPSDEWLVSAGYDGKLCIWDVASGKRTRSIDAHDGRALCVDVTDDGKTIVSGGGYGWLCIWQADSGVLVHRAGGVGRDRQEVLRAFGLPTDDTAILCLSLAPGCRRVALGRSNGAVELWDVQAGKLLRKLAGHDDGPTYAVSWGPNGKWFATGGWDEYVRVWDAGSGKLIRKIKGPPHSPADFVLAIDVSPDGHRVLSAGGGRCVQVWEVDTGTLVHTSPTQCWNILAAVFAPDGERVITGGRDWCIWDPRTAQRIRPELAPRCSITAIAASKDGNWYATGGADGSIKLWDARTGQELRKATGHTSEVTCLVADPSGTWIASGSWDTTIRLWDARSGAAMRTRSGHEERIIALTVTPDGKRLVSGSFDGHVTVWGLTNGQVERTWRAHKDLTGFAITRDGERLLSSGADGQPDNACSIRTWDLASGDLVQTLGDFSGRVNHVFIDPTERYVVTESRVGVPSLLDRWDPGKGRTCRIRVWDAKTGERMRTIAENESEVAAAALSPDGLVLATAGSDGTVTLWDVGRGEAIRELSGAKGKVTAVAFSRGGHWVLACGTEDRPLTGYLKVWEVATGARLGSVEVEVAPTCMLVHGSVVWLGAEDGSIRRYAMLAR